MTIDHSGIYVSSEKHKEVVAWYEAALKPLGYKKMLTFGPNGEAVGMSDDGARADWWVVGVPFQPNVTGHHAFTCKDRATVDAFHSAAMAAGAKDNGKPGLRPQYSPNYYGAFVLDPCGNNIEAVCRAAEK